MSRLRDNLFNLEGKLSQHQTESESDALERRLLLRRSHEAWGDERYREGYTEGMGDVHDSRADAARRDSAREDLAYATALLARVREWADSLPNRSIDGDVMRRDLLAILDGDPDA